MEYKSRKEEEFDSIYRAHVDSIFKLAMHYTKDYDTAQEITQAAFFKLYKHFENVDRECIHSWLVRTARNVLVSNNRSLRNEILRDALEMIVGEDDIFECEMSLEDRYLRNERKQRAVELSDSIFEKLYKKNKQWYEAIMLVYCLGKPQQEVAEELGIAIEVLHCRIYRARKWIRKKYEKEYEKVIDWF